jgi:hypothetical protein
MARNALTIVLGLLLAGALCFIFLELPDHCDDDTSTFHSHCHHMRDAGVNCRPGQNCWDDTLGDSTPGTTGWVIIGAVIVLLIVVFVDGCGSDERPHYVQQYAPRYYPQQPTGFRVKDKKSDIGLYPHA